MQDADVTTDDLTTAAVARALVCSEATVRAMANRGELASVRLSSGMRIFRRADVDRVLAARRARQETP